jgi:hypothetical protein
VRAGQKTKALRVDVLSRTVFPVGLAVWIVVATVRAYASVGQ